MTEETSAQKLVLFAKEGLLFHGSPRAGLTLIEPKPAKHSDKGDTFHNDTAVFASDAPDSTVIFAIVPKKSDFPARLQKGKFSVNWSADGGITARLPLIWKSFLEKHTGYVYVLPPKSFTENTGGSRNNIHKSKVAVKPLDIIPVTLKDYLDLGGKIVWYELDE